MEEKSKKIISASVLAFGIALGGFFPGYWYYKTHADFRSVTVKGLAEKDVSADLGIWNLQFTVSGNNLAALQQQLTSQKQIVIDFLHAQGFSAEEINIGRIDTNDIMANPYRDADVLATSRFILTQNLTIRSPQVEKISTAVTNSNVLIGDGIVISNQNAAYFFTKLNEIKPQMLKESTENARSAALEFAKNSDSKVGKIKNANQGVFSVLSRDDPDAFEPSQINKKVRVVSTVEYLLQD